MHSGLQAWNRNARKEEGEHGISKDARLVPSLRKHPGGVDAGAPTEPSAVSSDTGKEEPEPKNLLTKAHLQLISSSYEDFFFFSVLAYSLNCITTPFFDLLSISSSSVAAIIGSIAHLRPALAK